MAEAAGEQFVTVEPPTVIDGLKHLYNTKLKPLEETYRFADYHSPYLLASDFDAKPMVLLLGQYSVGKTSFIKYLLGRDFPSMRIGPEPTTDRFVAVMNGPHDRVIPGNAACMQADMPFRGLTKFGTSFLNKFEACVVSSEILEKICLIDTPGVLAGAKQRMGRQYDFVEVVEWFAERADMILLLFDAHKLDISDEFKATMEALKGHDDKVRVVLNKADAISGQQLMRVYGALMWSLGKVVKTPEVLRVYISSFWEKPFVNTDNAALFEAERNDLLSDLRSLPRNAAVRKVNELVKRTRLAKCHAYIIGYLRNEMPALFGKDKRKKELIDTLSSVFFEIHKARQLPVGDFPNLDRMKGTLAHQDFTKFAKLNERLVEVADSVLMYDIPRLMRQLGEEHFVSGLTESKIDGGAMMPRQLPTTADDGKYMEPPPLDVRDRLVQVYTKFNPAKLHAVDAILREYHGRYDELFASLEQRYGWIPPASSAIEAAVAAQAADASGGDARGRSASQAPQPTAPAAGYPPQAMYPQQPPAAAQSPYPQYGAPAAAYPSASSAAAPPPPPRPAAFNATPSPAPAAAAAVNPFGGGEANPFDDDDTPPASSWALAGDKPRYEPAFYALNPEGGKVSGGAAKNTLAGSGLAKPQLRQLWTLADIDKDGFLDLDEFVVAMHLIQWAQSGQALPDVLPDEWVPPSKRTSL